VLYLICNLIRVNSMSFDLKKARTITHQEKEEIADAFEYEAPEQEPAKRSSDGRISWTAPEYEVYEKSTVWYLGAALIIFAIATYAMVTESPIMAITFILIGVVGYLYLQKDPRTLDFNIDHRGIRAGRELYEYDNMDSFWIFYDPPHTKTLSLRTKASMIPFVHIPIADEDPLVIREILLEYLPEIKQEPNFVDALERFLHI